MGRPGRDAFFDPARIPDLGDVIEVAAGDRFGCARTRAGKVLCWGDNDQGQLGNGTKVASAKPLPLDGIAGAVQIAAGSRHACALLDDATVRCWGADTWGQLGDNTHDRPRRSPVQVKKLTDVAQISLAGSVSCARLRSGEVRCWGSDAYGQLGVKEPFGYLTTPRRFGRFSNAIDVAASAQAVCAVLEDGTVQCAGQNTDAELGEGDDEQCVMGLLFKTVERCRWTPGPVAGVAGAKRVSVGGDHACSLDEAGGVTCWGNDAQGAVDGKKQEGAPRPPTPMKELGAVAELVAGTTMTCVLLRDAQVCCWGAFSVGIPHADAPALACVDIGK